VTAPTPIAWDTVENAIKAWMATSTGLTSIWRDQSGSQPDRPYASLLVIAGPTRIHGLDELRYTTDETRVFDVKVTPLAQANTKYTAKINDVDHDFTSDATPTVAEITAGLTAAINAGAEPVTATDNGTDLDIVGDGDVLFALELTDDYDGDQLSFENNDLGHEVEIEASGLREMTVSCQTYVAKPDSRDPTKNAKHLMSLAQSALGLPSVLAALRTAGVSVVDTGPVQNVDALLEDAYEARCNMDVRFGLASNVAEYLGYIKTVEVSSTSLDMNKEEFGG